MYDCSRSKLQTVSSFMVEYMGCFFCTYYDTETDNKIKFKNAFSKRRGKQPRFCQKLGSTKPGFQVKGFYKRNESLQLRLWNLNSTSNSPVTPRRLSYQISANQREAERSANVNPYWKTRAKGNDVITYVISANQHFASTLSMQIFKFPIQRSSCQLSFLFPTRR